MNRPLITLTLALIVVPSLALAEELERPIIGDVGEMSVPTLALPASGEWLPGGLESLNGLGFPEVAERGEAPELVGRIRYEVASGDTLSEIAEEYDVSVEDIRRWNGLDSDRLDIGQVLTIRTSGSSASSSSERERST